MKAIMLTDYSKHNQEVFNLTSKNHLDYCTKYNIDFLTNIKQYSAYINFNKILELFKSYDVVITIGTDILITDFNKNIFDFVEEKYSLIIQKESEYSVNGDFIIFNRNSNYKVLFNFLMNKESNYKNSQDIINTNKEFLLSLNTLKILPVRTLQSVYPYGMNENNKKIKDSLWHNGDFSVHCHRPGVRPNINHKIEDLNFFKKKHNII